MTHPPAPHHKDSSVELHHGDCLEVLRSLPDASVDSVVTDPPYGLSNTTPQQVADTMVRWINGDRDYIPVCAGFMGRSWDAFVPPVAVWDECLRVLKPGGHVLAFAGSRTHDLMTIGLRLAGFDIRDSVAWLYGSGFPKSLDVSKAIDKAAGAEREVVSEGASGAGTTTVTALGNGLNVNFAQRPITAPATPDAERWQGWGTALKPAFEPIVVARKPLAGTVAANVLTHGTGALNIGGCRTSTNGETLHTSTVPNDMRGGHYGSGHRPGEPSAERRYTESVGTNFAATPGPRGGSPAGRWPANVILDESQAEVLDRQGGASQSRVGKQRGAEAGDGWGMTTTGAEYDDVGGASRFFYVAKADASERVRVAGVAHPTVKPLELMRWLVRLVTPPGGTVLEPFAGSGTTVEACILEGFHCIAIEREADYLPLIQQRIHRRRDPVAAVRGAGEDGGLFDLLDGGVA